MTIYVDELKDWPLEMVQRRARRWGTRWCHLLSDSDDLEELHRFAQQLGLRTTYFQNHVRPRLAHYDLLPLKRAEAIKLGAVEVNALDWARETLRLAQEA